jgi:GTPase SAR1 family protein
VGNKLDLRTDSASVARLKEMGLSMVTYEEGLAVAKESGAAKFMENSALHGNGVKQVFDEAIRAVISPASISRKKMFGGKKSSASKSIAVPPELPKQDRAPWINIQTAIFAEEWKKSVNRQELADVIFKVEDKTLYAHKVRLNNNTIG